MRAGLLAVAIAFGAAVFTGAAAPAPAQQPDAGFPQAPDGKRGFGEALDAKQLAALLRSKSPQDREFLQELVELAMTTRVQLLNVTRHYSDRKYFYLLPGSAGDDLAALNAAYAKLRDDPGAALAPGDARAKALAAMLVDTKFNVRRELLARAVTATADLEHARAVFDATQNGFVELTPGEIEHIAARGDFAAAELRAVRSDLEALKPQPADAELDAETAALVQALLAAGKLPDERARAAEVRKVVIPRNELEKRMEGLLFSTRIEPKLKPLRQWRDRSLAAAADLRHRTLEMMPDTPEGEQAPAAIAKMKKTDRMASAHGLAIEGLANDPLDAELSWAAGHAMQFAWPSLLAITYFDRFLALSGIRTSDANPGNGRKLTPREQEAYSAVTAFRR